MQPETVMLLSSVNIFAQDISRQLGRSFIYIRKNKGPSILPWGTPQVNLLALDNAPLTLHFWDQPRSLQGSAKLFHDRSYQRPF